MSSEADARDARFAELNDRIWGEGNWVRCPTCPHDDEGHEVYHHRNAHGGGLTMSSEACDSVVGYGSVEFACQLPNGHDGQHQFREVEFTVLWTDLPTTMSSEQNPGRMVRTAAGWHDRLLDGPLPPIIRGETEPIAGGVPGLFPVGWWRFWRRGVSP